MPTSSASFSFQPRPTLGTKCATLWAMVRTGTTAMIARHAKASRTRRDDRLNQIVLAQLDDHIRRDIGAPARCPLPSVWPLTEK